MQTLQLSQYLRVVRVTLMHRLKSDQCAFRIATVHLQLRMAQCNGQFGLGLAFQRTLQQAVGFLITALFIGRTGGTDVIQQGLALCFGGAVQVAFGAGPAALGEVHLALLDSDLHTTAAVAS